jgi:nicotinate phosphoribosyltransferase
LSNIRTVLQVENLLRIDDAAVLETTNDKIRKYIKLGVSIAEFGTRRRHSYAVQQIVTAALKDSGDTFYTGTSNVHFAMNTHVRPIGTHAHEWFMYHAAQYGFVDANPKALDNWRHIYNHELAIALSDTFTSKVFYSQFGKENSKLFNGVRQDSGDPIIFAEQTISHYREAGIEPLTKTIIFSDALDYDKVQRITEYCSGKIGFSFGIGTNFTNDVGLKPMNIVMKMTDAKPMGGEWQHVIKLSDEPGKHTGDEQTIKLAKTVLKIQ